MENKYFIAIVVIIIILIFTTERLISGGPPEFVFYHNPKCSFCQPVYPEWDILSKMDIRCAKLIMVDNTVNGGEFAAARGDFINKTPTIVFYPWGKYNSFERYDGPMYANDMYKWLVGRLKILSLC